ncbi:hypothetical protein [Sagittula salina]|uniref:Uncharacterized protein n=1 Tax=Sagittula salina TaxID=2820268 RepID=A0A940S3M6_9RHOB|nr:hypothetical protein [Sagittula salina]MBP0482945.1 hypothetical protein [Sagittula salina]
MSTQILGKVSIFTDVPILEQIARDMLDGIADEALCATPVDVVLGVHRYSQLPRHRGRPLIGIQTEHFLDATGARTDETLKPRYLASYLRQCDLLVDLSPYNRPYYPWATRLLAGQKLIFGPYLFPSRSVAFDPGRTDELLFVGALNDWRRKVLGSPGVPPVRVETDLYGGALSERIRQAAAMVNLHRRPGVYSEVPRLLSAVLAGKAVVSEPLAPPFVAGRHYVPLGAAQAADFRAAFEAMRDEIAARYSFEELLRRVRPGGPNARRGDRS